MQQQLHQARSKRRHLRIPDLSGHCWLSWTRRDWEVDRTQEDPLNIISYHRDEFNARLTTNPNHVTHHSWHLEEYHQHLAIYQQDHEYLFQSLDFQHLLYQIRISVIYLQADILAKELVSFSPIPQTNHEKQYPKHSRLLCSEAPSYLLQVFVMWDNFDRVVFVKRIECCLSEVLDLMMLLAHPVRCLILSALIFPSCHVAHHHWESHRPVLCCHRRRGYSNFQLPSLPSCTWSHWPFRCRISPWIPGLVDIESAIVCMSLQTQSHVCRARKFRVQVTRIRTMSCSNPSLYGLQCGNTSSLGIEDLHRLWQFFPVLLLEPDQCWQDDIHWLSSDRKIAYSFDAQILKIWLRAVQTRGRDQHSSYIQPAQPMNGTISNNYLNHHGYSCVDRDGASVDFGSISRCWKNDSQWP